MSKLSRVLLVLVAVVVTGGSIYLAAWDPPAPSSRVEKVVPNDRFPR
jgi:hypothetical protein